MYCNWTNSIITVTVLSVCWFDTIFVVQLRSFFRNRNFILDEIVWWNTSKFALFFGNMKSYEKKISFVFHFENFQFVTVGCLNEKKTLFLSYHIPKIRWQILKCIHKSLSKSTKLLFLRNEDWGTYLQQQQSSSFTFWLWLFRLWMVVYFLLSWSFQLLTYFLFRSY